MIKRHTTYETDDGFELTFEPDEESIVVKETSDGYTVLYLSRDNDDCCSSPSEYEDDGLFLVFYHRQCWITNDKVIKENDVRNWFRQDFEEYKDDPYSKAKSKFPWDKDYHIFALSAYIHSGVRLSLSRSFPFDPQGWDTSTCGMVMASKKEWRTRKQAIKAAQSKVDEWNMYLSGDVWGVIQEHFDVDKKQLDHDSCWGFYGHEYAMEEIKDTAKWIDEQENATKHTNKEVGCHDNE